MPDITDTSASCGACGGTGRVREEIDGQGVSEACFYCSGRGVKTVRVFGVSEDEKSSAQLEDEAYDRARINSLEAEVAAKNAELASLRDLLGEAE